MEMMIAAHGKMEKEKKNKVRQAAWEMERHAIHQIFNIYIYVLTICSLFRDD